MIKRMRFGSRRADTSAEEFAAAWRHAVGGAAHAPPEVRPLRIAVCTALPGIEEPRHDGIGIEWFADADHLRRYEKWLESLPPGNGPVVVAEESVMRGAEWLERRWREGGGKLKHMAVALRAETLSRAEFAERWHGHAGRVRQGIVIPDDMRGLAYLQNHPDPDRDTPYDAVNEVYFDDLEGLRARVEWFRRNPPADDLVGRWWFLAVSEELILG